eukprot:CAMPEP_0114489756 /NCGR_PEP_ID=MMETSP0109-20121206/2064_1 /TAXON_ID=29199 /ORGANISM="Chlorarachnion reptans, Strain CCCM449" /LENGTH=238 /DNA_ID=CAMNT_0001666299 /DNA_START=275 /DNA_END=991 /DNA_ORIENTATION=+
MRRGESDDLWNTHSKPSKQLLTDAMEAIFKDDGWQREVERDGVEIFSRRVDGSRMKQIRGRGKIKCEAEAVLRLFQASSVDKIREFNPMYDEGKDIQRIDDHTKISWSKTHGVALVKPRDFVTFVQLLRTRNGDYLILNESTNHPKFPPGKNGCVRANMLLGANAVRPLHGQKGECEFTFVQHVDIGGSLPTWLMNRIMLSDSVKFVKRIEKAARSPFPRQSSTDGVEMKPLQLVRSK